MENVALITGGSSGIGYELARVAAREGNNLLLVARRASELETAKNKINHSYPDCTVITLALDLTRSQAVQTIIDLCKKQRLDITVLINNAGFGDYGLFGSSQIDRQKNMLDLNITSLTELTHALLPQMQKNGRGRIMNLGSVASFLPGPYMSVYFATKAYVLSFSQALSEELRGTGITVTCLCPGPTKTQFGNNAHVSDTHATANPTVTAKQVAEYGWRQMQRGRIVAIYGIRNKISVQLSKCIPRPLLARLVGHIQK